jgi:cyanate permease
MSGRVFFGWKVTGGAFVLAVFGWGLGFYGPPVFLGILSETRGWSPGLISAAITVHYLVGAAISAKLPRLHERFGAARATQAGAVSLALGALGWSIAAEPWHLFPVAVISGAGWAATSSAALNTIIAPWFVRARPTALGMAYNGASVGGIIFSPLWVAATQILGFPLAASAIGIATVMTVWVISAAWFSRTPDEMGLRPDGDAEGVAPAVVTSPHAVALPGRLLWRDLTFLTLAAGMALGLFAQLGLFTHLFSLLVPAMGAQQAGLAMSLATILALAGRMALGWIIQRGGDRQLYACANYTIQLIGSLALLAAGGTDIALLMAGVLLFGLGVGNTTSLPPLIAQVEFVKTDVLRVVALIVSMAQAAYAFSPAVFGLIRELTPPAAGDPAGAAPWVFIAAATFQALAIAAMLVGRNARVPASAVK